MYSVSQASILQLCYIDPLIIDVALMLGNSCNKLRETLIHNDTFTHSMVNKQVKYFLFGGITNNPAMNGLG